MIKSINPADNKEIKSYNEMNIEEIDKIISLSHQAFLKWKKTEWKST